MRAWRWLLAPVAVLLVSAGCGNPARPDCAYSVTVSSTAFGATGGSGAAVVTPAPSTPGCSWTVQSNTSWLTFTGTTSGTRQTTVGYQVGNNATGAARTGTITVGWDGPDGSGSADAAISQGGAPPLMIFPTSQSVPASGADESVAVSATSWTATVTAGGSFVTITSGATSNSRGSVTYTVAANTTNSSRSAAIFITGPSGSATLPITQSGVGTILSVSPTNPPAVAAGGQSSGLSASVAANVPWTASVSSDATSWLSITSGVSGNGNGTITYAVAANNGGSRTGTITVTGGGLAATVTVTQSGTGPTSSITVSPPAATVGPGAQSGTAQVTANVTWMASVSSDATSWLHVTNAPGTTGTTTLAYAADPNSGGERHGDINLSGGTATAKFTVTQQQATVITPFITLANPNPSQVGANGGTFSASVHSNTTWAAVVDSGDASWLTVNPPSSGSNDGSFSYTVGPNSTAARPGHIRVKFNDGTVGDTLNVSQASGVLTASFAWNGTPCTFTSTGNSGDAANHWTGCAFDASASTGPIQTYEFHWVSPSGSLLSPTPLTTPTLSSGQAPCNLTGGVDADINVYLIVKSGAASSTPVSKTIHVIHGGCV